MSIAQCNMGKTRCATHKKYILVYGVGLDIIAGIVLAQNSSKDIQITLPTSKLRETHIERWLKISILNVFHQI